jgi:hypothetical protein
MEFKDIITKNLENSGLLNMIRAELRSEIFENIKKDGFGTEEAKRIDEQDSSSVLVIKDFLEISAAENTLKTFLSEISGEFKGSLENTLKSLDIKKDSNSPIIFDIIRKFNERRK